MNCKGYGRKQQWPYLRYKPGICLERLKKTINISIRIAGVPTGIRTQDHQKTKPRTMVFVVVLDFFITLACLHIPYLLYHHFLTFLLIQECNTPVFCQLQVSAMFFILLFVFQKHGNSLKARHGIRKTSKVRSLSYNWALASVNHLDVSVAVRNFDLVVSDLTTSVTGLA